MAGPIQSVLGDHDTLISFAKRGDLSASQSYYNWDPTSNPRGCTPEPLLQDAPWQTGPQYFFKWDIWSAATQPLFFTPRKDPCALCCRGEQVGHLGPRLPHDPPPHAPCRSHKDSQGPPRHHPQPGFLAPAGRPGQCPEAEEERVKEDERGCAVGALCVPCSPDPDAR